MLLLKYTLKKYPVNVPISNCLEFSGKKLHLDMKYEWLFLDVGAANVSGAVWFPSGLYQHRKGARFIPYDRLSTENHADTDYEKIMKSQFDLSFIFYEINMEFEPYFPVYSFEG